MESTQVVFKKLHPKAKIPEYKSNLAAGMDLSSVEDVLIPANRWRVIGCGFAIAMPPSMEAQVRPRGGLASKHGLTVLNTPGTVDADFRGEIKVILINHSKNPYHVFVGERIAQLVFAQYTKVEFTEIPEDEELDKTERGEGGFGSTGKN